MMRPMPMLLRAARTATQCTRTGSLALLRTYDTQQTQPWPSRCTRQVHAFPRSAAQLGPRVVAAPPTGPPKNEEIDAMLVTVVNEEGRLNPPETVQEALRRVDRKTHHLVQVNPETEDQPAVCKIISKAELYTKEKEKRKNKSKAKANQWKQLEINWGTSMHDLKQKYKKMKEMFDKGKSVEIILLPKKRTQRATQEQAVNLLKQVKIAIIDLDGKEIKPMDGVLLGDLRLFAEKASEAELLARRLAREAEAAAELERQRQEQERLEQEASQGEDGQLSADSESASAVETPVAAENADPSVPEGETLLAEKQA